MGGQGETVDDPVGDQARGLASGRDGDKGASDGLIEGAGHVAAVEDSRRALDGEVEGFEAGPAAEDAVVPDQGAGLGLAGAGAGGERQLDQERGRKRLLVLKFVDDLDGQAEQSLVGQFAAEASGFGGEARFGVEADKDPAVAEIGRVDEGVVAGSIQRGDKPRGDAQFGWIEFPIGLFGQLLEADVVEDVPGDGLSNAVAGAEGGQAAESLLGTGVGGVVGDVEEDELIAGGRGWQAEVEADRGDRELDGLGGGDGDGGGNGVGGDGSEALGIGAGVGQAGESAGLVGGKTEAHALEALPGGGGGD